MDGTGATGGAGGAGGTDTLTGGAGGLGGTGGSAGAAGAGGTSGVGGAAGTAGTAGVSGGPPDPGCSVRCDDGVFCNGLELCAPNDSAADADGCVKVPPNCQPGQACDEGMLRCVTDCGTTDDADGDGYLATDCGGDDCNDAVSEIHPDAVDVCNAFDDDCDGAADNGLAALGCLLPSAVGVCNAGHCEVVQCLEGAQDCDGLTENGCELADVQRGDCKSKDCTGKAMNDDTDVPPDDGNDCTSSGCTMGKPFVDAADDGAACGDGGECQSGVCAEEG